MLLIITTILITLLRLFNGLNFVIKYEKAVQLVESEGIEPSSKQVKKQLSTNLVFN